MENNSDNDSVGEASSAPIAIKDISQLQNKKTVSRVNSRVTSSTPRRRLTPRRAKNENISSKVSLYDLTTHELYESHIGRRVTEVQNQATDIRSKRDYAFNDSVGNVLLTEEASGLFDNLKSKVIGLLQPCKVQHPILLTEKRLEVSSPTHRNIPYWINDSSTQQSRKATFDRSPPQEKTAGLLLAASLKRIGDQMNEEAGELSQTQRLAQQKSVVLDKVNEYVRKSRVNLSKLSSDDQPENLSSSDDGAMRSPETDHAATDTAKHAAQEQFNNLQSLQQSAVSGVDTNQQVSQPVTMKRTEKVSAFSPTSPVEEEKQIQKSDKKILLRASVDKVGLERGLGDSGLPPKPNYLLTLIQSSSSRDKRAMTVNPQKKYPNEGERNSLSPLVFGNSTDEQEELNLFSKEEEKTEKTLPQKQDWFLNPEPLRKSSMKQSESRRSGLAANSGLRSKVSRQRSDFSFNRSKTTKIYRLGSVQKMLSMSQAASSKNVNDSGYSSLFKPSHLFGNQVKIFPNSDGGDTEFDWVGVDDEQKESRSQHFARDDSCLPVATDQNEIISDLQSSLLLRLSRPSAFALPEPFRASLFECRKNVQFEKQLWEELHNFDTFRGHVSPPREENEEFKKDLEKHTGVTSESDRTPPHKPAQNELNLMKGLRELQVEVFSSPNFANKPKENPLKHVLTKRQFLKLSALVKGFKVRKVLKTSNDLQQYMNQIQCLQLQLLAHPNDKEVQIKMRTKKHIFIFTLDRLARKSKRSSFKKDRVINESIVNSSFASHDINEALMERYLRNQKLMTVNIAFARLFDSQCRFKILAKKGEVQAKELTSPKSNRGSVVSFQAQTEPDEQAVELKKKQSFQELAAHANFDLVDADAAEFAVSPGANVQLTTEEEDDDDFLLDNFFDPSLDQDTKGDIFISVQDDEAKKQDIQMDVDTNGQSKTSPSQGSPDKEGWDDKLKACLPKVLAVQTEPESESDSLLFDPKFKVDGKRLSDPISSEDKANNSSTLLDKSDSREEEFQADTYLANLESRLNKLDEADNIIQFL